MGADALSGIKTWHNTENLFSLAHFVGCTRPGTRSTRPTCQRAATSR